MLAGVSGLEFNEKEKVVLWGNAGLVCQGGLNLRGQVGTCCAQRGSKLGFGCFFWGLKVEFY